MLTTCEHEVEFAGKLVEIDQRVKSNQHRLDAVEKNQEALNSIATSVAVMAEQQKNISNKVNDIDSKVGMLEAKPGKRWDGVVDKILAAAAGAFVAWAFTGPVL